MTGIVVPRRRLTLPVPTQLLGAGLILGAAGASAGALVVLGFWALLLPAYAAAALAAFVRPKETAAVALCLGITFEAGAFDFTKPVSAALYQLPPGWENAFGLTVSPLEIVAALIAASLTLRGVAKGEGLPKLPAVAWAVPIAMLLGLSYGLAKGAPTNLAYTEMRGLMGGVVIFVIASRLVPTHLSGIVKVTMASTLCLALLVLLRWAFYTRTGNADVAPEFQFAHENSVLLGIGFLLGATAIVDRKTLKSALWFGLYCGIIFMAMIATGRRAATLVLLVGGVSMAALLLPRRPVLVVAVGVPVVVAGAAYLGAYWNKEYGTLAQPARAIRSEFDPTLRDQSSDTYRQTERYDVIETIRLNRVFGVGFGRPFIQFQPLPYLGSFWSMQSYTPHQSVLWLWLKMGWFGISVFLGFWLVVLKRCFHRIRTSDLSEHDWLAAAVVLSASLMFLTYATVDLALAGQRQIAPMAILAAIAVAYPAASDPAKKGALP